MQRNGYVDVISYLAEFMTQIYPYALSAASYKDLAVKGIFIIPPAWNKQDPDKSSDEYADDVR